MAGLVLQHAVSAQVRGGLALTSLALPPAAYAPHCCCCIGWLLRLNSLLHMQIIAFRSFISLLLSVVVVLQMRRKDPDLQVFGKPCCFGKLLLRGVAGAGGLSLYYFSINSLHLGDAVAIHFTSAIATPILSTLSGYHVPRWAIAAAFLSCAGELYFLIHIARALQ